MSEPCPTCGHPDCPHAAAPVSPVGELARLRDVYCWNDHEIQQTLGKALGYPWFKDDPDNFPNATEADGVCVGPHVAATLAGEAADRIAAIEAENARLKARLETLELQRGM